MALVIFGYGGLCFALGVLMTVQHYESKAAVSAFNKLADSFEKEEPKCEPSDATTKNA